MLRKVAALTGRREEAVQIGDGLTIGALAVALITSFDTASVLSVRFFLRSAFLRVSPYDIGRITGGRGGGSRKISTQAFIPGRPHPKRSHFMFIHTHSLSVPYQFPQCHVLCEEYLDSVKPTSHFSCLRPDQELTIVMEYSPSLLDHINRSSDILNRNGAHRKGILHMTPSVVKWTLLRVEEAPSQEKVQNHTRPVVSLKVTTGTPLVGPAARARVRAVS